MWLLALYFNELHGMVLDGVLVACMGSPMCVCTVLCGMMLACMCGSAYVYYNVMLYWMSCVLCFVDLSNTTQQLTKQHNTQHL